MSFEFGGLVAQPWNTCKMPCNLPTSQERELGSLPHHNYCHLLDLELGTRWEDFRELLTQTVHARPLTKAMAAPIRLLLSWSSIHISNDFEDLLKYLDSHDDHLCALARIITQTAKPASISDLHQLTLSLVRFHSASTTAPTASTWLNELAGKFYNNYQRVNY